MRSATPLQNLHDCTGTHGFRRCIGLNTHTADKDRSCSYSVGNCARPAQCMHIQIGRICWHVPAVFGTTSCFSSMTMRPRGVASPYRPSLMSKYTSGLACGRVGDEKQTSWHERHTASQPLRHRSLTRAGVSAVFSGLLLRILDTMMRVSS